MTNFTLQPGDWIPTSEVPADKRQAVIDAFAEAGAKLPVVWWRDPDKSMSIDWCDVTNELDFFTDNEPGSRRVTLEQILGKQSIEQMEPDTEHWQRVGPELLRVLEKVWSNPGNKSWLASDYGKDIQEAITKARSIT